MKKYDNGYSHSNIISCHRRLDCTEQELSDTVEQKTELEASLSQCHRENDQLTASVSLLVNSRAIHCIDIVECSRTKGNYSCSR